MKKFAGTKPLATIKAQCAAAGVAVDDFNYRKHGSDYIALGIAAGKRPDGSPFVHVSGVNRAAHVFFNTFNGRFSGYTDKGVAFRSDETAHENEPWFQALLSFFYVEKGEPGAEPKKPTTLDYMLAPAAKDSGKARRKVA